MKRKTEQVVGQLLDDCRRRMAVLGINFAELARRMDLSRARVSELFGGRRNLTVASLLKLAGALGCSLQLKLSPRVGSAADAESAAAAHGGQPAKTPTLRVSARSRIDREWHRPRA